MHSQEPCLNGWVQVDLLGGKALAKYELACVCSSREVLLTRMSLNTILASYGTGVVEAGAAASVVVGAA